MKPKAIHKQMWDDIYDVYVKDKYHLDMKDFFEQQSPAALQEITAIMMETARKGMWKASEQQLKDIAELHTELVNKYAPACSGFVCDNAKLREFIGSKTNAQSAARYKKQISEVRESVAETGDKGMLMKKEEMNPMQSEEHTNTLNNTIVAIAVVVVVAGLIVLVRRKRKQQE